MAIIATTMCWRKLKWVVRVALQIGHADVVEHVGSQGVDHHHQSRFCDRWVRLR